MRHFGLVPLTFDRIRTNPHCPLFATKLFKSSSRCVSAGTFPPPQPPPSNLHPLSPSISHIWPVELHTVYNTQTLTHLLFYPLANPVYLRYLLTPTNLDLVFDSMKMTPPMTPGATPLLLIQLLT